MCSSMCSSASFHYDSTSEEREAQHSAHISIKKICSKDIYRKDIDVVKR